MTKTLLKTLRHIQSFSFSFLFLSLLFAPPGFVLLHSVPMLLTSRRRPTHLLLFFCPPPPPLRLYTQRLSRVEDSLRRLKEGRLSRFKHQQEAIEKDRTTRFRIAAARKAFREKNHAAVRDSRKQGALSVRNSPFLQLFVSPSKKKLHASRVQDGVIH